MCKLEQIRQIMEHHHLFGEVSEVTEDMVAVEIQWGDWKHDHQYLKWVVEQAFPGVRCESVVTEEDGSDCYSAIHRFFFNQKEAA